MKVTINNLNKATALDVFNTISRHLLTQGKKSKDGTMCVYHAKDGSKCAAGCLIPKKRLSYQYGI